MLVLAALGKNNNNVEVVELVIRGHWLAYPKRLSGLEVRAGCVTSPAQHKEALGCQQENPGFH